MNRALVAPASLPASYEQLGANTCAGGAELARSYVRVSGPSHSGATDGKPARTCISTFKKPYRHLSKVSRLEMTPVLCFLRVTSTFNRTLVSVRNWWEPISHA
jgi:hypothetical protein